MSVSTRIARVAILMFAFTIGMVTVGRAETAPKSTNQVVVVVNGLACRICVHRLQKVLGALPGATKAQVNLENGEAVIDFTAESKVADEQIRTTIKNAGFVPGKIVWRTATKNPEKQS